MPKIIDKIRHEMASSPGELGPFFSYEFFPPKTEAGTENLYLRMERMTALNPIFVDITWGAGGSTKDLTMAIASYTQTYFGTDVMMHLSCTNLRVDEIKTILRAAREAGIQNILALRGDPPKGALSWEPIAGGLSNAIDLVRLIREEHGDYFGIAVAGFPEGHPASNPVRSSGSPGATSSFFQGAMSPASPSSSSSSSSLDSDIRFLREKVDAGADFVLTQFFYDPDVFLSFVAKCRATGIACPIIPGMMPIQSYSSFQKMTSFCRTRVPEKIWRDLAPVRENDEEVKAYGVRYCTEMCQKLWAAGVPGFHFYTLNLEKSVLMVLEELGVKEHLSARRPLPWRGSRVNLLAAGGSDHGGSSHGGGGGGGIASSVNGNGSGGVGGTSSTGSSGGRTPRAEDVRPINWANRPKSYIKRTVTWDEFPNGRWGDGRSPAFGELSDSHFFRPEEGSKEDRLAMWGQVPIDVTDIYEVFALYVEGRIPILPWCESIPQAETRIISTALAAINRAGFLTINSQPAVNGARSDHPDFGWGGKGGRVYQRAYLEFFTSPEQLKLLLEVSARFPSLQLSAVDCEGKEHNNGFRGVTALTWGVFPNREILQPTIFDTDTFLVWSQEAFQLWTSAWASLYDDETESSALLYDIHDSYFLVAIVDNDYIDSCLYAFFDAVAERQAKLAAGGGGGGGEGEGEGEGEDGAPSM